MLLKLLFNKILSQWVIFVVPALYILSNMVLFQGLREHNTVSIWQLIDWFVNIALPIGVITVLMMRILHHALQHHQPLHTLAHEISNFWHTPDRLINGVPAVLAVMSVYKSTIELKVEIPVLHPFDWDARFAQIDRALHFGFDPWVLLQPMMGFDAVTLACNVIYVLWFFVMFATLFWFAFQKKQSSERSQFFLAFMLLWWLGGGLLALTFSSAGPAYYAAIGLRPNPFAELMAYLHQVNLRVPIWSLVVQDQLWSGYLGKVNPIGISAFPSMHNGTVFLIALALRKQSKMLSNVLFVFTAGIFVSSVHLGWHYAVDGYAAFVLAGFFWWLAGAIVSRLTVSEKENMLGAEGLTPQ